MVLVAWFVGCLVGYQCKASIDSIWGKRLVAWFVCCWGYPPFLFYSPSFGWCVGWLGLLGLLFAWIWFLVVCFRCLVCWLLGGFVGLAALLLGWLAGTPLMDAWMDGWMDPVLPHVPEASGSVSGGSRRSGQSLRSFLRVPKG